MTTKGRKNKCKESKAAISGPKVSNDDSEIAPAEKGTSSSEKIGDDNATEALATYVEQLRISLEKSSYLERKNTELMSENDRLTIALETTERGEKAAVQSVHETLGGLEMRLRDALDDGAKAREERELQRRRVLELEGLFENKDAEHSDRINEITISLENSESEVARLNNILSDLQQQANSSSGESTDQIRSLGDKIKILETELSDALGGSSSYRTMIESLEDEVAAYSQSETALNARLLELEGLLEQARVTLTDALASKATCEACEAYEKKIESLEIMNKKLYAKAKLMMKELKESQAAKVVEGDSMQELNGQHLDEIARLKLQLSHSEKHRTTSEETQARLEADLSLVYNELRLAQDKISQQVSEADIALAQELSALTSRFDLERAKLNNEIDDLSKRLTCSSSDSVALSGEILNLKEKLAALEEELAMKNVESGASSDEIRDADQRLQQAETRVSELEWSLAAAEDTVGEERERRERQSEQVESITSKLRDTIAALKAQRSRVVELEDELEEEKKRSRDCDQLVAMQQSASSGHDDEVDERNAAVAAGLARVAEVEAAAAEAEESYRSQIANLTVKLASLEVDSHTVLQGSQSDSERSARLAELESVLATTQYEVQLRDDKITDAESQMRDLKVQLENANGLRLATYEELRLLKGRFESLESEKASIQLMLDKAEADREATHARITAREEELATQMKTLDTTNKKLYAKLKLIMKESNEAKEKCAQAVSEKGRLQISLGDLTDQLQNAQSDVTSLTGDKDSLRRRVNELEGLVDSKSAKERKLREEYDDKINNLSKQVIDLTFSHTELNTQVITLRAERDEARKAVEAALIQQDLRGNFDAEEKAAMQAAALEDAKKEIEALKEEIDVLMREKSEFEARMEAMSDKVSRMKTLLVKSKTLAQEREAEVTRAIQAGPKIRRFSIQARVSVASTEEDGDLQNWCLLLEEIVVTSQKGAGDDDMRRETLTARWVDELSVHQWVEEGAELLGSWPELMQDVWAKEMQTVRSALETERDSLRSQLDDITKSFNTYKARAQLALKRLGQDDREEKRAFLTEGQQIVELQEQIADLQARLTESIQRRDLDVSARDSKLQDTEQLKISLDNERALVSALQLQVHELSEQLSRTIQAGVSEDKGQTAGTTGNSPKDISEYETDTAGAVKRSDEEGRDWGQGVRDEEDDTVDTTSDQKEVKVGSENVYSASDIPRNDFFNKAVGKTLLLQRVDNDVRNALGALRAENTKLVDELDDVKLTLKLNNEQMAVLKSSIVDLEASLMRERLLNADNDDRINADYLVSTLRKFLLTDDANERARLVEVVTQILQLRVDESKAIIVKWAAKKSAWFGGEEKKSSISHNFDFDDLDDDGEYRNVAKSAPLVDDPYNGYNAFGEGGLDIHT